MPAIHTIGPLICEREGVESAFDPSATLGPPFEGGVKKRRIGLILSGAFGTALKGSVWRHRSIKTR
jgi:hypothetical protein